MKYSHSVKKKVSFCFYWVVKGGVPRVDIDEKHKPTSITAKVWMSSLNSHFGWSGLWHKMLKRKEAEQRTPHFLSLNQDIVAWSQDEKCGLKYVMFS